MLAQTNKHPTASFVSKTLLPSSTKK